MCHTFYPLLLPGFWHKLVFTSFPLSRGKEKRVVRLLLLTQRINTDYLKLLREEIGNFFLNESFFIVWTNSSNLEKLWHLLLSPCWIWMTRNWTGHLGLKKENKIIHRHFSYECCYYWLIMENVIMLLSRWFCWAASSLNIGVQCFWHVSIFFLFFFFIGLKSKVFAFCEEWTFLTLNLGEPQGDPGEPPEAGPAFQFSCTPQRQVLDA